MSQTAMVALLAWPVICLLFFAVLGPWRGVITSYIGSYLFLSGQVIVPMAGLPDYTKFTAANLGVLIGILIFDLRRFGAFRPRWYDSAALILCSVPIASFLSNGLELWPLISAVNSTIQAWGIPYFVGRLYFGRPGADRDLALGMTLAGVLMTPLILFEVFGQTSISGLLYGIPLFNGYKYGFYRPVVMAANSLELALWSTLTAISAFSLWVTRAVSKIAGVPFGLWTAIAIGGAIICLETAALGFLIIGIFLIAITAGRSRFGALPELLASGAVLVVVPKAGLRFALMGLTGIGVVRYLSLHRNRLLILMASLAPPIYLALRISRLVSREALTSTIYAILGNQRGWSFAFRIIMEDRMIKYVMQRPLFGWATYAGGRARAPDVKILDSMWIIFMGIYGIIGLASLYALLCLPVVLTSRRRPVETWSDPRQGAVVGLAVAILMYTYDSMLNAYSMIPVPLIVGLVMGLPAVMGQARSWVSQSTSDRELEQVDRFAAMGRVKEAEAMCRRVISVRLADRSGHASLADAYDRRADLLETLNRHEEAEPVRRQALELRIAVASSASSDPTVRATLAGCCERLARTLVTQGRWSEAIEIRGLALEQRAAVASVFPEDQGALIAYADDLNDLAWLLSVGGDRAMSDPPRAVAMAEQAVRIHPGCKSYWNTLGAAYVRAGDPSAALAALRQSLQLGPDETGFDEILRAMALASLGDPDGARESLGRVDQFLQGGRPASASLLRLRTEATEMLGTSVPAVVQ
ncbi:tetratricopeptide repeat protein [Tautonia rosea]|uniref:tetratricopeptide repeat protein n=1 Tax=Tautonia rosea TaxID=2728037 RepID=UPI001475404B|nr:tetratricopeptide repeat protein [Tautonia rosea]